MTWTERESTAATTSTTLQLPPLNIGAKNRTFPFQDSSSTSDDDPHDDMVGGWVGEREEGVATS